MNLQFTHPYYLLLLAPALAWVFWFTWKSDVQVSPWRRWTAAALRVLVLTALVFAIAGLEMLRPIEGMNVFFLLDRSDSIPAAQQEAAREYVVKVAKQKKSRDKAGVIVFGSEASIEASPGSALDLQKIQAVVGTERTDIAAAVRLGTAAFPETGQKRLVLLTDGNENLGDVMSAVLGASQQLGVTVDVLPMGISVGNDVSVQKLQVPSKLKKGQPFEVKIHIQADQATPATVRLFRNDQFLGEKQVQLSAGKNLFAFPQVLSEPGYYGYDVQVDVQGDPLPQNNRASSFAIVSGDPEILIVSSDVEQDKPLAAALSAAHITNRLVGLQNFPATLGEMQNYDAIFLSNVEAGDPRLGNDRLKLLESAVRDFGVGLVCVGGDQTYAAGGYRGTPLESTLPVSMELDSKKVLPSGAVVLIMHGMEFANGNQVARDCAQGVLAALGPTDFMGVALWDGNDRWLFELQRVGDTAHRKDLGEQIAGMSQGDMVGFEGPIQLAYSALKRSTANLKHIIIFSDGDPQAPQDTTLRKIVEDRITVSTILIAGHSGPETMKYMAGRGKGRFYEVTSPDDLPQLFIKETAVILKSAIYEDPFTPQVRASSELLRGISAADYPKLLGYVATSPKPRAETPLWTDKGDPLLAHWQYGLGRAVAFTSDARAKWAKLWLNWPKYRQFWSQIGQWSLRRLDNADFNTEVTVDKGEGVVDVDASDAQGNYRNFLNLQAVVARPKGQSQNVRLEQTGPGHYQARFQTREVGSYVLNLLEVKEGKVRASQRVGASVNYSPEFTAIEPNLNLLRRIAEGGKGKILDPASLELNPFSHDRQKTYQPRALWEDLIRLAILLFLLDVAVRRIQLDPDELRRAWRKLRARLFFWETAPRAPEADESLNALLARRQVVRSRTTGPAIEPNPELFRPEQTPAIPASESEPGQPAPSAAEPQPAPKPTEPPVDQPSPASTTSRLLEAKRRAQQRKK